MAPAKVEEKSQTDLLWDEILAAQLTPEEKDQAHVEAMRRCEQAFRDGVYERALEIVGTVKWSISWQNLRLEER